jgi:flagellar basal-body rod modification protein FlgD
MDTSSITSSTAAAQGATSAATTAGLGKNDFLKLLTAQLANQDPLQPVDNQAFVAQLAQFSSLEQLQNVTSRLDTLLVAAASANQLSTASLVGKQVTYQASTVTVTADGPGVVQASLGARATVTAVLQDANGNTVRTLPLGTRDAGTFDLGWDGRNGTGQPVPPGTYTVKLTGRDLQGSDVPVQARASGLVSGITFDGSAAELVVGGNNVKLSDVYAITQN